MKDPKTSKRTKALKNIKEHQMKNIFNKFEALSRQEIKYLMREALSNKDLEYLTSGNQTTTENIKIVKKMNIEVDRYLASKKEVEKILKEQNLDKEMEM